MNNLYNSLNGYLLIGTMFVKQKTKQFNLFFKFIVQLEHVLFYYEICIDNVPVIYET